MCVQHAAQAATVAVAAAAVALAAVVVVVVALLLDLIYACQCFMIEWGALTQTETHRERQPE